MTAPMTHPAPNILQRLGLLAHQLTLFVLFAALCGVFWGFRPEPRGARSPREETAPAYALVVDVRASQLRLFRDRELLAVFPCGIGGGRHARLPAGEYPIHHQRADAQLGRVFALSYPSLDLARRAAQQGWIRPRDLARIGEAHRFGLLPPQDTRLGPSPLIVGGGRATPATRAIALDDEDLERLAPFLTPGTRVILR